VVYGQWPHPFLVVWVDEHADVPREYVKNNEIVLNIAASATQNLRIDNEWVSFSARFAGVSRDIWVPVGNVMSIFARETGEGMGFEVELSATPGKPALQPVSGWRAVADAQAESPAETPPRPVAVPACVL
jgi:stringent starvation protein B